MEGTIVIHKNINLEYAQLLLETLACAGERGCGVISLSLKTGIRQMEIRTFFESHKHYCVSVSGRSKYKINVAAPFYGNVEKMIDDIKHKQRLKSLYDLTYGHPFI